MGGIYPSNLIMQWIENDLIFCQKKEKKENNLNWLKQMHDPHTVILHDTEEME